MNFSSKNRPVFIQQLNDSTFDVLVIGGGITGAGIALDASSRGLKVALIEMQDFASGTSGRSTKLIHGGLRYLKQLEFKLVAEVGKEREIIHHIAPHLAKPEPMLLPIVKHGSLGKLSSRIGMWIYEWLAGVKKEERHKNLSLSETILTEPLLQKNNLTGGILFYEYRTDDSRLTIEVMKEAVQHGAVALNYVKATSFIYNAGKISGVVAEDQLSEKRFGIKANYVVNATGPWVEQLEGLDHKKSGLKLRLTKGAHIVVEHERLPVKQSLYFDAPDKRMIFVIPRDKTTYIGTTDTFYSGELKDPKINNEDIEYLLKCVNIYFPSTALKKEDIISSWAGLRPLINKPGDKPSEISRKDELFISDSGLITIAGGKLTGYRKMSQRVVDKIADKIHKASGKRIPYCTTDKIVLSGGKTGADFFTEKLTEGFTLGLNALEVELLLNRYGSKINLIFEQIKKSEQEKNNLPLFLRAQIIYAVENEMCISPSDFIIRRTGMLYFEPAIARKYKREIVLYMQNLLNWSDELRRRFEIELEKEGN